VPKTSKRCISAFGKIMVRTPEIGRLIHRNAIVFGRGFVGLASIGAAHQRMNDVLEMV
jgi:hypothetical protein